MGLQALTEPCGVRVDHRQTQSCSHSRVHDVAPGDEQLLAQVGARGCGREETVLGSGLGPAPRAPPPLSSSRL